MTDSTPAGGAKRPLFKRTWVWVVVGVFAVLIIIGALGSKSTNAKGTPATSTTTSVTASTTSTVRKATDTSSTTAITTSTRASTATTHAPTTTTRAPTTTAPRATTVPPTSAPPTTSASYPMVTSPSGNLYHAGELCPKADVNMTVEGSDGPISCEHTGGYYRWVTA